MSTSTAGQPSRSAEAVRSLAVALRSAAALRAKWGIIDQGISSFTSFAVTAVVAHEVSPKGFGAFSVALATYICLLWAARSIVGEPYVVRWTKSPLPAQNDAARQAVGTAVLLGTLTGTIIVVIGAAFRGPTGAALAAMGGFLPSLLGQDAFRYVMLARGQARGAAANDGLCLVVQALVTATLLASGRANLISLIVAFGVGATAGAMYGVWQTRSVPSPAGWRRWLHRHVDLWLPFLLELLTVNAVPQLSILAIALTGGVVTVGAIRAGLFLFAPLSVLFSGLYLVALPEAVRLRARSDHQLRIFLVCLAVGMAVLDLFWVTGISVLPYDLGRTLLKSNWASARDLRWAIAAFSAAFTTMLAANVGLRALDVARQSMRIRIWAGPLVFLSGIIGVEIGGAQGAAFGLAISSGLSAALAWAILLRAMNRGLPSAALLISPSLTDNPVPVLGEWT